ncbi:fluoride efflux transporter CrcB [Streptomyces sp. VRA16 Mangrove soil]|uniref:fluoride efflux transporter CrcB n=1 Tax=Streptomyces sp. VRA16 Mangrove soil TaxID=2817434 RepID=UPI001A9DAD5A|nr:fluoride efflux transporter CrcB [Streptomyces sp. VRA16 Mangrove soil]MBO1331450.1 fluoride efflux transporter CrcB [Streptomyces sp. VRA16 Mangrove soil]
MLDEPVETAPAAAARPAARRREQWRGQAPVIAAVSVGGAAGASARYGAALLWPTAPGAFPWTTLCVNAVGCAVIGVFMVVITEVWAAHHLVRPFFGTGVLGGFTTFSTYAVDIRTLTDGGHARTALGYLALTVCVALAAVWTAARLTRRVIERRSSRGRQR